MKPNQDKPEHKHAFRFDGDDPYLVCVCGQYEDAMTGRVITYGKYHKEPLATPKGNQDKPETGTYFGDSGLSYQRTANQDSQDELSSSIRYDDATRSELYRLASLVGTDAKTPFTKLCDFVDAHTQRAVTEAFKQKLTEYKGQPQEFYRMMQQDYGDAE